MDGVVIYSLVSEVKCASKNCKLKFKDYLSDYKICFLEPQHIANMYLCVGHMYFFPQHNLIADVFS